MQTTRPKGLAVLALPILMGLALFAPAQAHAQQTFASFAETDAGNGFIFTNSGSSFTGATVTGLSTATYSFNFSGVTGLTPTSYSAKLALSGTTTDPAFVTGGRGTGMTSNQFFQTSGPITLTFTDAVTGKTLLVATVRDGNNSNGISILQGSTVGTAGFSTTPSVGDTVTFASPLLNFSGVTLEAAAFAFNSLNPATSGSINADGLLNSFAASFAGSFSSTPVPAAVPEPASLAMLAIGLVGLPVMMARRNRKAPVASA